jgi:hypothetical protein
MRIHDDRYSRERLRFHVALRFIRLEARTRTIRQWTGLSDDRIRKLCRGYTREADGRWPVRHRGKSPQQPAYFTRSARARQEAAVLASLYCLLGALPLQASAAAAQGPASLGRGELLCQAYEAYRALIAAPLISFEHAVFLLSALWSGQELVLSACEECSALLVADRWSLRVPRCSVCMALAAEATAG